MLHLRPLHSICILLGAISTISASSIPYAGNPNPFSITPYFIYTSSKPSAVSNGYMYTTQAFNGAGSNVIFKTGADSIENLKAQIQSSYASISNKEGMQMGMEKKYEKNAASSESISTSNNMVSDMRNTIESSAQRPEEQGNQMKDMMGEYNEMKPHQAILQPLPLLQNPVYHKNLLDLRHQRIMPKFYVIPNILQTPQYQHNGIANLEYPSYTFNNPFVRLYYQTPLISTTSGFQSNIETEKAKDSTKMYNNERMRPNCLPINVNNINSSNIKTTPASEYVANAVESSSLNITSNFTIEINTTMSENNKDTTDQTPSTESSTAKTENDTVTSLADVTTEKMSPNCSHCNVNDINSSNIETTPASEYVANAVEKLSLNVTSNSTSDINTTVPENIKDATDQTPSTESSTSKTETGTVTSSADVTTEKMPPNCSCFKFNNINSRNVKTIPASEYVANALEKSSLNITSSSINEINTTVSENIKDATDQTPSTESSTAKTENDTVTSSMDARTEVSSMSIVTTMKM